MAAAAAQALRSLRSRVKGNPGKMVTGLSWLEHSQKVTKQLKEILVKWWGMLDQRVENTIVETVTRSAMLTLWGAGVLTLTNTYERLGQKLGVVDTTLLTTTTQKEVIAALVKEENEKTLEKVRQQQNDDSARFQRLSKEFHTHRELTKLWLSHLLEKTVDSLSKQEIFKIQQAFALFDKDGDGFVTSEEAKTLMQIMGNNISEDQLQKLMLESGQIALPELLLFIAKKQMEATQDKEVTPEAKGARHMRMKSHPRHAPKRFLPVVPSGL